MIPHVGGHRADAFVGLGEQAAGRADALGDEILVGGNASMLPEYAPQQGAAYPLQPGQAVDGDGFLKMLVNVLHGGEGSAALLAAGVGISAGKK